MEEYSGTIYLNLIEYNNIYMDFLIRFTSQIKR